jgi:hypothetical protein
MKNNFGLDAMNILQKSISGDTNLKQNFLIEVKKIFGRVCKQNFLTKVQNDKYLLLGPL